MNIQMFDATMLHVILSRVWGQYHEAFMLYADRTDVKETCVHLYLQKQNIKCHLFFSNRLSI